MVYTEVYGDLIKLAKEGEFDVIAHGCNCFCTMGAGIAPQMAKAFGADLFPLEQDRFRGNLNKLGMIDYKDVELDTGTVTVVNAYTQYRTGFSNGKIPLDYEALTLCFRKMNRIFRGKHIGLPQIGCGLAGGDWEKVRDIIKKEFTDCVIIIVIYKDE